MLPSSNNSCDLAPLRVRPDKNKNNNNKAIKVIIHFAWKCNARRRRLQSAQRRGRVMDYWGGGGRRMEDGWRAEGPIHAPVHCCCCWCYRPHRPPGDLQGPSLLLQRVSPRPRPNLTLLGTPDPQPFQSSWCPWSSSKFLFFFETRHQHRTFCPSPPSVFH